MNNPTSQTLAEIVTNNHRSAAVLEKYQLDFCCKGKRSLQQACNEQNISVDELLQELENTSGKRENAYSFDKLSLSQLIDHIVSTHHAYVKTESPQLAAYLQKVASKHGSRHPELFSIFEQFTILKEEMEQHMRKEEAILFSRIKELELYEQANEGVDKPVLAYLQAPIQVMETEHEEAGAITEELRKLTNNYTVPHDACTTYKLAFAALNAFAQDLHQHVHLENNILFPKTMHAFRRVADKQNN